MAAREEMRRIAMGMPKVERGEIIKEPPEAPAEGLIYRQGGLMRFTGMTTFHAVTLSDASKEVFRFSSEGALFADWAALRAMKDRFDAGCRDWPVIWAAAIWTARNS